jgi:hypothetical protein
VPGLCFLSLSLLSVKHRTSYPVMTEQVDKPAEAVVQAPPKKKASGRRGRPPGSKNRNPREVKLSPSLGFIQEHIQRLLEQIGDAFKVVYFIFDGELGHNDAMQMVRQMGLHLVSKLRHNSALYFPYIGKYLSGISKLSHVVALKKGIETELRASRPLISFGMRTLGMTRQIHDSCLQRPIEPGDIACFQGLDHVT